MNVVQREKRMHFKSQARFKNELVRKDLSLGIRGPSSLLPVFSHNVSNAVRTNAPRYQFNNKETSTSRKSSMGPPLSTPRSIKRRIINSTSSTKPESSSSGRVRPRILASDSAVADTSHDLCTPRNRPTALRYISSSSRGGYSGTRSGRSTSTSAVDASVILAISEGRGQARGEIGIAAVDLRHPHLVLCQFSDTLLYTHTLTKINYFNPVEIIVPHTFCDGVQPNQLYQLIRDHYPLVNLTTVQRRHFNDAAGRQHIQTLCAPQYSAVYLQVLHKFYALTAAAAVLKYVEYIQCVVFARESLKIEYHSSENTMIIDVGTATQLELVQPLVPSAGPTCCLLGVLGPTYTVGGIRALRAAILQPSSNKEFIEGRLDAVQDLIENDAGLMTGLQDVIKKLSDIDKILLLCVESPNQGMDKLGEAQLNQTLLLKTTMDMVPKLVEALNVAESGRLRSIKVDFENPHYKEIADRIRNIIQDDAHLEKGAMGSLQRCFAVKPDINGLLDVARRTYSELIEDIQKIVEQLSETYDLPLRLNQNIMKGFHIILPIAPKNRRNFNVEDLPDIFIQVHNGGASVSMTTEELVVLDQQAKESLNEIQKMSNIVVSSLLKELRPFMSSLYKLCENVAEIDILLALAQASTIGSYIRPEFSNYLDIRNSIHPLLDYNSQVMPIPNDIVATPEHNFTIITGPNMGGKSIYIKQIAMMQIMAQLGCFLPATNAVLRLCDRIFSRIGFNDSVEFNASTYVFEMKEMQHILKGLTQSSLVIIDELCRGTCTEEGASIAWAICEELVLSEAFTFFTTHFMYLTRLQELYFNVVNRHTAVTEEEIANTDTSQKRLVYQHKIVLGITKTKHYGLALAAKTNLPEDTVKLANELAELIVKTREPQQIYSPQENDEYILYKLNAEIRQKFRKHEDTDDSIRQILRKFKEDYPLLIETLKVERSKHNIRTDSSANYSSVPNSKPQESSNEDINSGLLLDKRLNTTTQSNNNMRLKVFNAPNTVTNNNVNSNEEDSMNSRSVDNFQRIPILAKNTQEIKVPKPHITIYSTSDDAESEGFKIINNQNCTSVKSSNELLTTVLNRNNSNSTEHDNHSKNAKEMESNIAVCNNDLHNMVEPEDKMRNSDLNNNSVFNNSKRPTQNEEDMELDESILNYNNIINDSHSCNSDSDIADALTQIIEECSIDDNLSENNEMNNYNEDMSMDEELMTETVKEIYEDMIIEDSIVLTPPLGFRD